MNRKIMMMSIVALVVSVAFVSAGMADQKTAVGQTPAAGQKSAAGQTAPAKASWEKARGLIEKVDEATKQVTVQTEKEKMTFSVGEQTRISEVSTKLPLSDLKKGMSVTVGYKKEGNKMVAEWIDVTKKVEAKKETPAEVKKVNPSEKATEKK
jgi:Cu/Ag efflux protein CusF